MRGVAWRGVAWAGFWVCTCSAVLCRGEGKGGPIGLPSSFSPLLRTMNDDDRTNHTHEPHFLNYLTHQSANPRIPPPGLESEIVAAVNAQREDLGERPRRLGVEAVMAAPKSVMYQQACKITQVGGCGHRLTRMSCRFRGGGGAERGKKDGDGPLHGWMDQ